MSNCLKYLCFILFASLLYLPVSATEADDIEKMMQPFLEGNDPDTAKMSKQAAELESLAVRNKDYKALAVFYQNYITYLYTFAPENNLERAYQVLLRFRDMVEKTGLDTNLFYDSWQNVISELHNKKNIILAIEEIYKLKQYATERNDKYGLATTYMVYASIYDYSYERSKEYLNKALEYIKQTSFTDDIYYIHLIMAYAEFNKEKYDEALRCIDDMVKAKNGKYIEQVAAILRTRCYCLLDNKQKASENYSIIKQLWKDYKVFGNLEGDAIEAMCEYLCKYGPVSSVPSLFKYFSEASWQQKMRCEVEYYTAIGDYKKATDVEQSLSEKMDSLVHDQMTEEIISADSYYSSEALKQEKTKLEIENTHTQNVLLYVVTGSLVLLLLVAVYLIYNARSHNTRLRKARDDAQKASQLKDRFLEQIVHEVRTPINVIEGFSQLLTDKNYRPNDAEQEEYLGYIAGSCDTLITLVRDTLDISKIESGNYPVVNESFSLRTACDNAIEAKKAMLHDGVTLSLCDEPDIFVKNDRSLVTRIIRNYISNACKYTDSGEIKVVYKQLDNGLCQVAVMDTGCGIAAEDATKVFDNYEKLGSFAQGNGLGLSIVREAAKLIGAKAYLDTSYTAGCKFVLEL